MKKYFVFFLIVISTVSSCITVPELDLVPVNDAEINPIINSIDSNENPGTSHSDREVETSIIDDRDYQIEEKKSVENEITQNSLLVDAESLPSEFDSNEMVDIESVTIEEPTIVSSVLVSNIKFVDESVLGAYFVEDNTVAMSLIGNSEEQNSGALQNTTQDLIEIDHQDTKTQIYQEKDIPNDVTPIIVLAGEEIHAENTRKDEQELIMKIIIILSILLVILLLILYFVFKKIRIAEQKAIIANKRISAFGVDDLESAKTNLAILSDSVFKTKKKLDELLRNKEIQIEELKKVTSELEKHKKRVESFKIKLVRGKELYASIQNSITHFHKADIPSHYYKPLTEEQLKDIESIAPSINLNLKFMSFQDLRKEFRVNQKQIDLLLEEYKNRYTTKTNITIYKFMVMSLRSELQNILYNLKYEKLETGILQVKDVINKYLGIVEEANQNIAGTMRMFIGELEYLFINAVKIEYEFYIKKEQARQEQLELRQQMREEAEERKRLKEQEKQIAKEESKFLAEIQKMEEALRGEPENDALKAEYEERIKQLQEQLSRVEEKKEEISKLQHGKAGNVYIISNLGSFGDHIFKIGMTRRLDPYERVKELGSASVPFKFDIHSFIFSEDAVNLESEMHRRLHSKRVNKVNLRKEFFEVTLDELEQLVSDICPSAEFNTTMVAEEYKQSISIGEDDLPEYLPSVEDEDDDDYLEADEQTAS